MDLKGILFRIHAKEINTCTNQYDQKIKKQLKVKVIYHADYYWFLDAFRYFIFYLEITFSNW